MMGEFIVGVICVDLYDMFGKEFNVDVVIMFDVLKFWDFVMDVVVVLV